MDTKNWQYNKVTFQQSLILERPLPKNGKRQFKLENDNISKIEISNDISTDLPMITVEYTDLKVNNIPNFIADGELKLFVLIFNPIDKSMIKEWFVVDDIQIISKSISECSYRIYGKSILEPKFLSHARYSTWTNDDESSKKKITTIIREILSSIDIPIIPVKKDLLSNDCDNSLAYCAPVNATIREIVDYLLSLTTSFDSGLYFVLYDFIEHQCRLISTKALFSEDNLKKIKNYNIFTLASEAGHSIQYLDLSEAQFNNYLKATTNYFLSSKVDINNFDYTKRAWQKNVMTYESLLRNTPSSNNKKFQKILPDLNDLDKYGRHNVELRGMSGSVKTKKVNSIFKLSEDFQFSTFGDLRRQPTDIVFVQSYDANFNLRYGGYWTIGRIYHLFERGLYESHITLIRADRLKDKLG